MMVSGWRGYFVISLLLGTLGLPRVIMAQRTATITEEEAKAITSVFDSLLALGDPVGLDDILASDFTREVLNEGQERSVTQNRQAFLASITSSLSETDVTLGRKRSPLVVRIKPVANEAEVGYTVTQQAMTAEGTRFVTTIETLLKLGIRGDSIQVVSLQDRNRFKRQE